MKRSAALLVLLASCAAGEDAPPPPPVHQIFEYEVAAELTAPTGDVEAPLMRYASIPVDAKYVHAISFQMTPMMPPLRRAIPSHGPIILIGDHFETLVFSPLDHFFAGLVGFEEGALWAGIQGDIARVPAGFRQRFLLVEGTGIGATVARWGELMRVEHNRAPTDRYADTGLSKLGYWTDNGGYYYYKTEDNLDEAATLLAVKADADARGIPFGYFQLDSWWYFKAPGSGVLPHGGTIRWEPQPAMFPMGLEEFRRALGVELILHNRWFAADNIYRERHAFFEDTDTSWSMPLEGAVFDELMDNAVAWGAGTYEQDWLMPQYRGISRLRSELGAAESWIAAMHDAASARGLTMQITMAGPGHVLDALDRPRVTSVRTSIDYAPQVPKALFWPQFHTVNMIAGALGLLPFKDNFRSAAPDPGPEQEALISVLSAGMVGASDQLGLADAALLARTCRSDGLLLKPDRPAVPIDAMFLPHERPYLVSTYSDRGALGRWTYLAALHLARGDEERRAREDLVTSFQYDVPLDDMFVYPAAVRDWSVDVSRELGVSGRSIVYDVRSGMVLAQSGTRVELPPIAALDDYGYFVIAPVLANGIALIGERDKFVTLADKRFTGIDVDGDRIVAHLVGAPGERVTLIAYDTRKSAMLEPVTVELGPSGTGDAIFE